MGAQTSAGTSIALSAAAPETYDAVGFAALTFTDLGEVTNIGEFGRVYNLVTHNPLATRRTEKFKGSFDDGSLSLDLAVDSVDAGQILAKAALASDDSYSFEVTFQDGSISYFSAQTMSFTTNVQGVDAILSGSMAIEVDNDIVEVAAP